MKRSLVATMTKCIYKLTTTYKSYLCTLGGNGSFEGAKNSASSLTKAAYLSFAYTSSRTEIGEAILLKQ